MEDFRPPAPLQFSLGNVKEKWRKWRQELDNYPLATEKDDRTDKINIAILLNLLGSEGLEIYNTFKYPRALWKTSGPPAAALLGNVERKWRKWRQELDNYPLATEKKMIEQIKNQHCNPVELIGQ
ncbi:transposon Ty3-G Gag-Pol polyprotein [Trichonephila clavipes]|nr:transposon Ty3-G Gag-Pol polyprotein [Trichonephila clavipes]